MSKRLLINKNFDNKTEQEDLNYIINVNNNFNEKYLNENILDTTEKSNFENSNSNNISSLNFNYINNANNIDNDNISIKANIKNNKLLLNENTDNYDNNNYLNKNDNFYSNDHSKININLSYDNCYENKETPNKCSYNKKQNKDQIALNAILNVSDLNIDLEEEENNNFKINSENDTNISILKNITNKNTSFGNIKNNLKTKYDLENNKTRSYLMALQGYLGNNQDEIQKEEIEEEILEQDFYANKNIQKKNISDGYDNKHILMHEIPNENLNDCSKFYNKDEPSNCIYLKTANAPINYTNNKQHKDKIINDFSYPLNVKNINENINNYSHNDALQNQRISRQINQQQNHQGHARSKSQEVSTNNFRVPSVFIYLKKLFLTKKNKKIINDFIEDLFK
jgi:hypothetical protein